jgi:ketosteroid isomerase-like protein
MPDGQRSDSAFAHVWTVIDGKVSKLRQFVYGIPANEGTPH